MMCLNCWGQVLENHSPAGFLTFWQTTAFTWNHQVDNCCHQGNGSSRLLSISLKHSSLTANFPSGSWRSVIDEAKTTSSVKSGDGILCPLTPSPASLLDSLHKNHWQNRSQKAAPGQLAAYNASQAKIHLPGVSSTGCLWVHFHFQSYKTDVDWLGKLPHPFQHPYSRERALPLSQNQGTNILLLWIWC